MGLFERKDALPPGARRLLEEAFSAGAAGSRGPLGERPLPGGKPPALTVADAKAILKELDWDAPEAAAFLGAARIPKDALGAFKSGERPDLLAGVLKDAKVWPYFEDFLCCCCCGPCRLCRFYPFCKRRCGRVQVKLTDGSTLWAYRLEIEGVAVESIPGRPGVAKVSIPGAAGGVTLAAFGAHAGDPAAHGSYAPASHDASHDTHNDARYAPKSADPNGYANKGDLAGKAPLAWTAGMANPPTGYAPATGSAEYAPAKDASSNPIKYLAKGAGTPTNGLELANASDGTKAADVSTVLHAANAYENAGAVTTHAADPGAHGDFAAATHDHDADYAGAGHVTDPAAHKDDLAPKSWDPFDAATPQPSGYGLRVASAMLVNPATTVNPGEVEIAFSPTTLRIEQEAAAAVRANWVKAAAIPKAAAADAVTVVSVAVASATTLLVVLKKGAAFYDPLDTYWTTHSLMLTATVPVAY